MFFAQTTATILGAITMNSTSSVVYSTTSDRRLKDEIGELVDPLDVIGRLRPIRFAWKADGTEASGFLADEVADVIPEAVFGDADAVDDAGNIVPQQLNVSALVPFLVAAVQELAGRVAELEAAAS